MTVSKDMFQCEQYGIDFYLKKEWWCSDDLCTEPTTAVCSYVVTNWDTEVNPIKEI